MEEENEMFEIPKIAEQEKDKEDDKAEEQTEQEIETADIQQEIRNR